MTRRRRILVQRDIKYPTVYHDVSADDYAWVRGHRYPTVTESAYRRDVWMPDNGSITSSGLSPTEYSLGAALVIAQGKHYKRDHGR